MRTIARIIPIALIALPTAVSAETWTAHTILEEEKSKPRAVNPCTREPVSYTLELTDNKFTATSQYGEMFSIVVSGERRNRQDLQAPSRRGGPADVGPS
jgi:hypothetical protein